MSKQAGSGPRKLYWDACVFLSLIEGDPVRNPVLLAILSEMDKGKVLIFTSTLSITEVAFAKSEKDGRLLDRAIEKKIDKLWNPPSPFQLVDVYRSITKEAKTLVRDAMGAGIPIKPADAIHLVTAKRVGASEFQTYDTFKGRLQDVASHCGIKVGAPAAKGMFVFPTDSADEEQKAAAPATRSPSTDDAMHRAPSTPPVKKPAAKPKAKRPAR